MSSMTRVLWVVMVALACAPRAVRAQDPVTEPSAEQASQPVDDVAERARLHFQKGVDYYSEGDLAAAMVELQRAYDLKPSYRLLYNLGQVAYEQRDYAEAERYFRDYLAQGGDEIETPRRVEIEQELERLKGRVADVMVRADLPDAELFVDEREAGRLPLVKPLRLSAGRRAIRAELPGRPAVQRVIDVVGGEPQSVELRFGPEPQTAARDDDSVWSSPALWTGIGTGVLALGAGGMALWTSSEQAKYDDAIDGQTSRSELDELSDSTEQKALITDVLLGAAVVGAAVTVVLLIVDDDSDEHAPSYGRIQIGPGSIQGTF